MLDLLKTIHNIGIVPVVKIDNPEDAVPLAKALVAGGLPVAEITFRTEHAKEAMERIKKAVPEMLIGAGTVLTIDQVDQAIEAGAAFVVSPGFNPETVEYCIKKNIPILPGCVNPSDIERAISYGLPVVKFFPAEAYGGLKTIQALAGPFPQVKFMPTGGVNEVNVATYLSSDKILACGGTWMVKDSDIKNGEFEKITQITKQAVHKIHGFKLAHVGINCEQKEEALKLANLLQFTFGFDINETDISYFASSEIEIMQKKGFGAKGHIGIGVNNIDRARAYLETKGFTFNEASIRKNKGKIQVIYMNEELAGFAFHIIQR